VGSCLAEGSPPETIDCHHLVNPSRLFDELGEGLEGKVFGESSVLEGFVAGINCD
jgi:hypothetical protein